MTTRTAEVAQLSDGSDNRRNVHARTSQVNPGPTTEPMQVDRTPNQPEEASKTGKVPIPAQADDNDADEQLDALAWINIPNPD